MILISWLVLVPLQAVMLALVTKSVVEPGWLGALTTVPSIMLLMATLVEDSRRQGMQRMLINFALGTGPTKSIVRRNQVPVDAIPMACAFAGVYFLRSLVNTSQNFPTLFISFLMIVLFGILQSFCFALFCAEKPQAVSFQRVIQSLSSSVRALVLSITPIVGIHHFLF